MKKKLWARAILAGLGAAAISWAADGLTARSGVTWLIDYGDDVIIGVLACLLAYQFFWRGMIISEVNHHVRNSLQVMLFSPQQADFQEALSRIDWTLKTVLRGKFDRPHTFKVGHRVDWDEPVPPQSDPGPDSQHKLAV